MHFKLRSIGNSVGIIFPNSLLKKHNLHIGDNLLGNDTEDSITLTVIKPIKKYNLRDLVAQSQSHELTSEDNTWLSIEDIGDEVVWK